MRQFKVIVVGALLCLSWGLPSAAVLADESHSGLDPFEAASCTGSPAVLTDFVKYFEPGSAQATAGKAEILVRERSWNKFTGVGPWRDAVVPEQPFVKIHTYNVGGSDHSDTVRGIVPERTVLTLNNETLRLQIVNYSFPYFDGVNHLGLTCELSVDNAPRCDSQYRYPSIVRTREGSEFTEVTPAALRPPYRAGEPLAFTGVVTAACLRFAAGFVDEEGGVEREFVIYQEF